MRLEQLERNRMRVKKLQALTFSICLFDGLINVGAYIRVGLYPE